MRTLEIALAILSVLSACTFYFQGRSLAVACVILTGLALLAHLSLEGAHWQMYPSYLAFFFLIALFFGRSRGLRDAGFSLVVLLIVCTLCCSSVLPMFRLPSPTGASQIGTRIVVMVDQTRPDNTGDPHNRKRQLVVQLWYPAAPSHLRFAPYRRREETTFKSSYQAVLPTHSRLNAPVAEAREPLPIILFNPAWTGRRTQNTYLVEDLASHGYLVVGIDHPGNSGPTAYPDGHVAQPISEQSLDLNSLSLDQIEVMGARELIEEVADDKMVLDELQRLNRDPQSPFYTRLDTNNAATMGHSFGGAVAAQASSSDPRVKSALDLDGSLFGEVRTTGLKKPFMLIEEDLTQYRERGNMSHADRINEAMDQSDLQAMRRFGAYRLFIHGSTHASFTDRSLFSPLRSLSGEGTLSKYHEYEIVRMYALAFFEKTLRGLQQPLLSPSAIPPPQVSFEIIPSA